MNYRRLETDSNLTEICDRLFPGARPGEVRWVRVSSPDGASDIGVLVVRDPDGWAPIEPFGFQLGAL